MCEGDAERWRKLIKSFEDAPEAAYRLALALNFARKALNENEREGLDNLIDALFPYTNFYDACRRLYWMAVAGKLQPQHDPLLAALAADPKSIGRLVKPKQKPET